MASLDAMAFLGRMASLDGMASAAEDTIFTRKLVFDRWKFEKGMRKGKGVFKSKPFAIQGLPWHFYLRMSETKLRYRATTSDEEEYKQDKDESIGWYSPHELTINGVLVKPISNYFSVQLCVENPKVMESELNKLELCGTLQMQQTSAGIRYPGDIITGVMFQPSGEVSCQERGWEISTGYLNYGRYESEGRRPEFNGWFFGTEIPTLIDTQNTQLVFHPKDPTDPFDHGYRFEPDVYRDFYTVGKVPRMVMLLTIGIPSKFKKIFKGPEVPQLSDRRPSNL